MRIESLPTCPTDPFWWKKTPTQVWTIPRLDWKKCACTQGGITPNLWEEAFTLQFPSQHAGHIQHGCNSSVRRFALFFFNVSKTFDSSSDQWLWFVLGLYSNVYAVGLIPSSFIIIPSFLHTSWIGVHVRNDVVMVRLGWGSEFCWMDCSGAAQSW